MRGSNLDRRWSFSQVRDLETELNEARAENAALGRKCFESYQALGVT